MDHLHVTHITEGLQIVKYRAPSICDRYNENKVTANNTQFVQTADVFICLSERWRQPVVGTL
jgi:hypothetical protein